MGEWRIERLSGPADLDGVLEVENASFTNPWTREMYEWELRNPDISHLFVLRTTGEPVAGFCCFWVVYDELHINNLAVRPACRGRGYGLALLEHALTEGARRGAHRATLEVRRSNLTALRLYERTGFELMGIRPNYYACPDEDALILWKRELAGAGPEGPAPA